MYSSKLFNKKDTVFKYREDSKEAEKQKARRQALAEKADAYGVRPKVDSRHTGKHFVTQPPLKGQLTGYFGYAPPKQKGDKEEFKVKYSNQQKAYFEHKEDVYAGAPAISLDKKRFKPKNEGTKSLHFGSGDVHRSDEFCNGIRQSQWKELLSTETAFQTQWANAAAAQRMDSVDELVNPTHARAAQVAQENAERTQKGLPEHFQTQIPEHLFDVGRVNATPICRKCKKDTFYCKHRVGSGIINSRRQGGSEYKTMSAEVGGRVWGVSSKPTHGRVRTTKQFFDISHLS